MIEKSALAGKGGGCTPTSFQLITISTKFLLRGQIHSLYFIQCLHVASQQRIDTAHTVHTEISLASLGSPTVSFFYIYLSAVMINFLATWGGFFGPVAPQNRQIIKMSRQLFGKVPTYDAGGRGSNFPAETCLSRDALFEDREKFGQASSSIFANVFNLSWQ